MSEFVTCPCQTCSGHLEFSAEHAGAQVTCPHCQIDTTLYIPTPIPVETPAPRKPSLFRRHAIPFTIIGAAIALFLLVWLDSPSFALALVKWAFCLLLIACGGALGSLYFLPAIVGRRKRNATAITLLNLFAGWTVLGWVVALVWASTVDPER